AQQAALAAVQAGANARGVDAVARERIAETGFGEAFGHGLGHGVGLLVHEAPRLSPLAPEGSTLAAGNVVTVEPGIYLAGLGGVRIEDLVIVGDDGPEVLTRFPKTLITVA
nr:M24 family metallopeptidase [Actinomycetota bacterium]